MNGEESVLCLAPRLTERRYNLQYVGTPQSEGPSYTPALFKDCLTTCHWNKQTVQRDFPL